MWYTWQYSPLLGKELIPWKQVGKPGSASLSSCPRPPSPPHTASPLACHQNEVDTKFVKLRLSKFKDIKQNRSQKLECCLTFLRKRPKSFFSEIGPSHDHFLLPTQIWGLFAWLLFSLTRLFLAILLPCFALLCSRLEKVREKFVMESSCQFIIIVHRCCQQFCIITNTDTKSNHSPRCCSRYFILPHFGIGGCRSGYFHIFQGKYGGGWLGRLEATSANGLRAS